ncbi:zinc finger BED domain-containing protein RICESLEEPER 3 [Tanacetum coccineum]
MAMDIIMYQEVSSNFGSSKSAFSTSGRVLSIRRTRLTPASLEMCMCLKDHLDAKERKQDKSPLEIPLDFEEDVLDDEVQRNEVIPLSDEEIALDASSEGTLSPRGPQYDYLMSSEDSRRMKLLIFDIVIFDEKKLGSILICVRRSYALSWKPCQGDSLNLPDHRIHKDGDGDASFQLESDSLPHAHAQTTKTYYKHQDSRIMKAQELKTKTSAQTLIYKIFLQRYQVYQGRLLASFQDDAKYEHVGQDTRSQGGKDDQDGRIKI